MHNNKLYTKYPLTILKLTLSLLEIEEHKDT